MKTNPGPFQMWKHRERGMIILIYLDSFSKMWVALRVDPTPLRKVELSHEDLMCDRAYQHNWDFVSYVPF